MSADAFPSGAPRDPAIEFQPGPGGVVACCSTVYGSPLAELIIGESLHPGGLASTRQLLADSGLTPGARLLDAGCGLGASSRLAAAEFGLRVDAVDASPEVIARAGARSADVRVRWRQADLLDLPFEPATFDGILAECVLSTLPRPTALAEFGRVLRPGGRLILSDVEIGTDPLPALTDHPILGAALCVTDAWRDGELDLLLGRSGFRVERRWDRTSSILALVERAEARIGFASIAARDLGIDLAALAAEAGPGSSAVSESVTPAGARRLADEVRDAVRRGDLRYFAVAARLDDPG